MELPEPAIRWLAKNSSSNTELACLSNVCTKWRNIVAETVLEQANPANGNETKNLLLVPSLIRSILRQQIGDCQNVETYCVSWFHPGGILSKELPLDPMNESDEEDDLAYLRGRQDEQHFAPSGQESYVGSEDEKKPRRHSRSSGSQIPPGMRRNEKNRDDYAACMYQWNGYKEARDILCPFGFSKNFIQYLVDQARSKAADGAKPSKEASQEYRTHAVRGATIARPEGYCLCWDNDLPSIESRFGKFSLDQLNYQQQNVLNQLARRRSRRRREAQREVLPRVINSSPYKVSDGHPPAGAHPAVQFLNVDFSHAVRLFTPPFKPGPIPTPITIFCVAIATEDGCFFSGLRNRFEFGHLYPETQKDNLIERSPICLCTNYGKEPPSGEETGGAGDSVYKKIDSCSYNSDDSSCDGSVENDNFDPPIKCACSFSGLGHITDESDDEFSQNICRGKRGPGTWHCYTVVVDGASSDIRIDGISEPLRCSAAAGDTTPAYLDGLTIGADHIFDMSLCFGQGSDGEGEGAMSELAVFKGRLDDADIKVMESHFMQKHGILLPIQSEDDIHSDDIHSADGYARLAHAMLSHAPHHKIFAQGKKAVPLRYMTKHRIVAWKQVNPVTGEAIRVSRIGTKTTDSASDW